MIVLKLLISSRVSVLINLCAHVWDNRSTSVFGVTDAPHWGWCSRLHVLRHLPSQAAYSCVRRSGSPEGRSPCNRASLFETTRLTHFPKSSSGPVIFLGSGVGESRLENRKESRDNLYGSFPVRSFLSKTGSNKNNK